MIKYIAFDLVGVLVKEKDIELTEIEDKIERLFGPNISDEEFIIKAKEYVDKDQIIDITNNIINKLYEVKNNNLFKDLKNNYSDINIIIATNHVSFVRNYIKNNFDGVKDIIISAEINKIKPNKDFYQYILDKYNIEPSELLFIDDNQQNIDGAASININTIKVDKNTNITKAISSKIDKGTIF